MRRKQIAAMGMIGVLLGAGSLLASTGGASAEGGSHGCAPTAATVDATTVAGLGERPPDGRRSPRPRPVRTSGTTDRLARAGHAPGGGPPDVQRAARDVGPVRRGARRAPRRSRRGSGVARSPHAHVPLRQLRSDRRPRLPRRVCAPSIAFHFGSDGGPVPPSAVKIGHDAEQPGHGALRDQPQLTPGR